MGKMRSIKIDADQLEVAIASLAYCGEANQGGVKGAVQWELHIRLLTRSVVRQESYRFNLKESEALAWLSAMQETESNDTFIYHNQRRMIEALDKQLKGSST